MDGRPNRKNKATFSNFSNSADSPSTTLQAKLVGVMYSVLESFPPPPPPPAPSLQASLRTWQMNFVAGDKR